MRLMSRKVFTSQKISLFLGGAELRVQALISAYGAKYVFSERELPEEARAAFGTEIQATFKSIPVRCRFVRETSAAGTIYSLRFLNPSSLLLRQIEKDVAASGLPSPWIRSLPRLQANAKHLPVPELAVADVGGVTVYMDVRNFTLGGVLLEYNGSEGERITVGTKLTFDLITNQEEKFEGIVGQVAHVTAELNDAHSSSNRYQFGLKIVSMSAGQHYRNLIRRHCEGLRNELAESPPAQG